MIGSELTGLAIYAVCAFALAWIIGRAKISYPIRDRIGKWLEGSVWECRFCQHKPEVARTDSQCSKCRALNAIQLVTEPYWLSQWILDLLECPGCVGFWEGLIWAFIHTSDVFTIAANALFTAGCNFIIGALTFKEE